MTSVQLKSIEQLIDYGFSSDTAKMMVRYGTLPCPLTSDVCLNVELLSHFVDLREISTDECDNAAAFLKRDNRINMRMASFPDRYAFTAEQCQVYFKQPLEWDIASDLKEEMDAYLKLIILNEENRMEIYREMYCNGVWWDCDTINSICLKLREIATGQTDLEEVVDKWWFILFSLYSGTLQYIEKLEELFRKESVWEILRDTIVNVREFSVQFNPFDKKELVLEELKEEYPQHLIKTSD